MQHVLTPRLRELTVFPETRPNGAVFVGPVEMARGLEFDIVFVPGLAEKLFPQRILQDPLLPDHVRRGLATPGLSTQDSRVRAERLALRLAAGAAKRHLALSWPRMTEQPVEASAAPATIAMARALVNFMVFSLEWNYMPSSSQSVPDMADITTPATWGDFASATSTPVTEISRQGRAIMRIAPAPAAIET